MSHRTRAFLPTMLLALACSTVCAMPDVTDAMFDPQRVIDVRIALPVDDWDRLRAQERSFVSLFRGQCLAQPFANPYTWAAATVTIDGQTRVNAAIRKKGFLGSLDTAKPALKIDLDEYQDNAPIHGVKKLTLNNAKQDPSLVRQCLGYQLFAKAGLPAPRCNFANVTVNGKNLGVYVNVEEIRKPMLARHFASNKGNLYEGTVSDFHSALVATFEKQTNKETNDRGDLQQVIDALAVSDADLPAALGALVDMERFRSFWALEGLLGHWDGYSSNRNNFYLYRDPASERFHFIPWGVDGVLSQGSPIAALNPAANSSFFAYSAITRRLVDLPDTAAAYTARMHELLTTVWDEGALLEEINRMQALLLPHAGDLTTAMAPLRAFISERRARVLQDLSGPPPNFPPLSILDFCLVPNGSLRGSFAGTWNTYGHAAPFATGAAAVIGTLGGATLSSRRGGADAGLAPNDPNPHRGFITLHAEFSDGKRAAIEFIVDATALVPGARLAIDGQTVKGQLRFTDGVTPGGLLDRGVLSVFQSPSAGGNRLCGVFESDTFTFSGRFLVGGPTATLTATTGSATTTQLLPFTGVGEVMKECRR